MFAGGSASGVCQFIKGGKEGVVALGEAGKFGWPVVHLDVDVAGVFAVPGWVEGVVPDALEVGGLTAAAAG